MPGLAGRAGAGEVPEVDFVEERVSPRIGLVPRQRYSVCVDGADPVRPRTDRLLLEAGATTFFALANAGVEAECAGVKTPLPGLLRLGERFADVIECADVNRGIRARRFAERGLIHKHDAADVFVAREHCRLPIADCRLFVLILLLALVLDSI